MSSVLAPASAQQPTNAVPLARLFAYTQSLGLEPHLAQREPCSEPAEQPEPCTTLGEWPTVLAAIDGGSRNEAPTINVARPRPLWPRCTIARSIDRHTSTIVVVERRAGAL